MSETTSTYCVVCGKQINYRYGGYEFKCECGTNYRVTDNGVLIKLGKISSRLNDGGGVELIKEAKNEKKEM